MSILNSGRAEFLRKNENRELLAVIFTSFIVHLALSSLWYGPVDFLIHYGAAKQISEGKILYLTVTAYQTASGNNYPYPDYPPVYPYMMGMLFAITGPSIFIMKAVLCLFNVACALVLYKICIGLRMTHRQALLAVLVLSFHPSSFTMTVVGFFDYLPVFFLLLVIYFLHASNPIEYGYYQLNTLLGGVALGFGIMTKLFPVLALVIVLPWLLVQKRMKETAVFLLAATSVVFLISLPFLIFVPEEFIYHVFTHVSAIRPNLSFYYYLFPSLYNTIIPLIVQLAFILIVGSVTAAVVAGGESKERLLISLYFLLIAGFLFLNRINYPHYAAWFTPFIVIFMVDSWKYDKIRFTLIVLLQVLASAGALLWSLSWINDPTFTQSIAILEHSGFLLFVLAFAALLLEETYQLKELIPLNTSGSQ